MAKSAAAEAGSLTRRRQLRGTALAIVLTAVLGGVLLLRLGGGAGKEKQLSGIQLRAEAPASRTQLEHLRRLGADKEKQLWGIQLPVGARASRAQLQHLRRLGVSTLILQSTNGRRSKALVAAARRAKIQVVQTIPAPRSGAATHMLRKACSGPRTPVDRCAVATTNPRSARAYADRGRVDFVVLRLSAVAAIQRVPPPRRTKARTIAVAPFAASGKIDADWRRAMALATLDPRIALGLSLVTTRSTPRVEELFRLVAQYAGLTPRIPRRHPTANVWVDANGGSCVRQAPPRAYVDGQACGSFGAAYRVAHAGDTVAVMPGTYRGQDLPNRRDLAVGSAPVTFCVASGDVKLTDALSVETHDVTVDGGFCGGANAWGGTAAHLAVTQGYSPMVVVSTSVDNGSVNRRVTVENVHMGAFYTDSGGTQLLYSEVGPLADAVCEHGGPNDLIDVWPHNGDEGDPDVGSTIGYDYIHEAHCISGQHVDGIQAESKNLVVIGNRIAGCSQLFDESVSTRSNFSRFSGNRFINNMVEMLPSNSGTYNSGCDGNQAVSSGPPYTVENNTIDGSFNADGVGGGANSVVVGNILTDSCGGAGTCDYNVFLSGHGDGAHARVCDPVLAGGSLLGRGIRMADFHLSPSDRCARGNGDPRVYPAEDINRRPRPLRAVDAGADEVP